MRLSWGSTGAAEGRALPGSWRAARASRRCARCCAGCSAAAGTPGWPCRCSGPFGIQQCAPNRNRTAGDPGLQPGPGTAPLGATMGMVGTRGLCVGETPPECPGIGVCVQLLPRGFGCTGRCEPVWCLCVCTRVFRGALVPPRVFMVRKWEWGGHRPAPSFLQACCLCCWADRGPDLFRE